MTQMTSIVRGTHLGKLLCPQPWYLIIFNEFPIFGKTGERPGSTPLWIPYFLFPGHGGGAEGDWIRPIF